MADLVLSPLTWLLVAVLAGWLAERWRRGRVVRACCAALAAVALAAMTPLAANVLLGWLENADLPSTGCRPTVPTTAVVLAGGLTGDASGPGDTAMLNLASRRRLDRAVAWWGEAEGRKLVMSGGSWQGDGIADARLMQAYARRLGVPGHALYAETRSLTTWSSARELAAMRPSLPRRIALVTSASHMPRAVYAMQHAGFDICPLVADRRRETLGFPGMFVPQGSALRKMEGSLHEVVGMAYYRWRARHDVD